MDFSLFSYQLTKAFSMYTPPPLFSFTIRSLQCPQPQKAS